MRKQKQKRKKRHKEWTKTIKRGSSLRDIFINRTNVFRGLTKYETISLYYNKPLNTILNYDKEKIEKKWEEICYIKKYLRKKKIMGIISKKVPRGFQLRDNIFGTRQLENAEYIYFCCSTLNDAHAYRNQLDKIAKGIFNVGNEIEEITESLTKQIKITEILNQIKP